MSVYFLGIFFIALIASNNQDNLLIYSYILKLFYSYSDSQCRPRHIQTNCMEIFMAEVDDSFRDEKVAGYCSRNSRKDKLKF